MFGKSLMAIIFSLTLTMRIPAAGPDNPFQTPKPSDTRIEKVKAKVNKIGVKGDITVFPIAGGKYHGFVVRISDSDFEITEIDDKINYAFQFSEVKKVDEGYGQKGVFGNRVGRRARRFGMIAGISVVALPIILLLAYGGGR